MNVRTPIERELIFGAQVILRQSEYLKMKRVAICLSGHIRHFVYENLQTNLINVFKDNGYQVDFFVSIWDTLGHRSQNWEGSVNINEILELLNPIEFVYDIFDRSYFIERYNTEKWKEYGHLSDHTTCGDAVSMWYKVQSCIDCVEHHQVASQFEYDFVARVRPDILFDTPFDISVLENIRESDAVFIPKWHGKWSEISGTVTDYFAIGTYMNMKRLLSVFNNIDKLISENKCPHTGEGFLYGNILDRAIYVKRLDNGFSVQRPDFVEKIV